MLIDEEIPAILDRPLLDPRREHVSLPALDCEALPGLHIHRGVGCNYCRLVCKGTEAMRKHYNVEHALVRRTQGGVRRHRGSSAKLAQDFEHFGGRPAWHDAAYQRFFAGGKGSQCFRVRAPQSHGEHSTPEHLDRPGQIAETDDSVTAAVLQDLATRVEKHCRGFLIVHKKPAKSEVFPWLERSRWSTYLDGCALSRAADLARPIDTAAEPALYVCSVGRVIIPVWYMPPSSFAVCSRLAAGPQVDADDGP